MYTEQLEKFRARRAAVIEAHIANDPRLRAARRRKTRRRIFGAARFVLALGVALFLIKSLAIAMNGDDVYTRLVAPAVGELGADHLLYRALMPDPATQQLADVIRSFLPDGYGETLATAPTGAEMDASGSEF
ncbi:MAG: hypothetical protein JJT99_05000 [Rhodobacteraceae bacterium]|nr:hypothetical protein [Paracoccaceae bacterium]